MCSNIKAALVIDTNDGYDEETSVHVLDLLAFQKIADNIIVITIDPKQMQQKCPPEAGDIILPDKLCDIVQKYKHDFSSH